MSNGSEPPTDVAGFDPVATAGDCFYSSEAADKAIRFFELALVHTKGKWAGKPFILEPWQQDMMRTLFGWKRPDGSRRFRTAFVFLPRKNGKSQIAAAIANYVLLCDGEAEAECYCAASDREQASLVFKAAASMLRKNPTLAKRVKIRDSMRRVVYSDSFLRAIPANEGGSHGFNSHLIVGDELHTWPNRDFYDTLHTSTGAREQPLEVYITTAGYDQTSICYEIYTRARQIRDGVISDPSFLPVIYEADEDGDWRDEATWRKANPNLGVSIRLDYIQAECEKAKENPAYENTFRRLHLNQWTQQDERWIQIHKWDASPSSAEPIEDGADVCGGLDLSSTTDFTAWVLAQNLGDNRVKLWGHYWLPRDRADALARQHGIPIESWVRDGWLTLTPGSHIEYGNIRERVIADNGRYNIEAVGYDACNAQELQQSLENDHGIPMVKVIQGMISLSPPSKQFELLAAEGKLDHSLDPVLRWMADNVCVRRDENNNIRPVKASKQMGYRHIDGIVAAIMAVGQLPLVEPRPTGVVQFA